MFLFWWVMVTLGLVPMQGLWAQETEGALAATSSEAQGKAEDEARRTFDAAVALFAKRDYKAALQEFERSQALSPKPVVLFNIAMCHKALDNFVQTAELLESYLADGSDSSPWRRAKAMKSLEELDLKTVRIELDVAQADARVLLDSSLRGTTPLKRPMRLLPGEHVVRVEKDGFAPFVTLVDGAAGDSLRFDVSLQPLASDQKVLPMPSVSSPEPNVEAPLTQPLPRPPQAVSRRALITGISTAVLGVAALSLGATFAAVRENGDVEDARAAVKDRDAAQLADVNERARAHEVISAASFAVGAVLVTTAIVLIATHRHRAKESRKQDRSGLKSAMGALGTPIAF
ncbi:MAG: PEGA domain-containing protein [Myxococcota bacterium]|jgi:hypothetical protein|nr:PEGA domain-containing protein [Myxococcota bacterium]